MKGINGRKCWQNLGSMNKTENMHMLHITGPYHLHVLEEDSKKRLTQGSLCTIICKVEAKTRSLSRVNYRELVDMKLPRIK